MLPHAYSFKLRLFLIVISFQTKKRSQKLVTATLYLENMWYAYYTKSKLVFVLTYHCSKQ